ncbi:MAG: hypothetical protein ACTHKG_18905 [Nocardioides sp.]
MTPRRPHPRLSVPTLLAPALAAAALLALTGCGARDAGAVSQGELSTSSAASSSPSETATAADPTETSEATPTESTSGEADPELSESPEPTESTQAAAPRLLAYAGGESPGAEIRSQADADKLAGAPEGFKQFIGRTAERLADGSTCEDGYVGVTVEFLRTDGYAVGGVNECGGYRALWAVVDGSWKEIAGSQEMWDCAVLQRYTVPSEIAGSRCYDYDAQKERDYEQA